MSTTSGTMKSFRVTDPEGNVYIMIPVDTTARTAAANASALATSLNVDSVKYKNIVSDPNLGVYNPESTYSVGNFCYYENELYECNTDISTAEAWNAAHWTKIIVKDLIDAAKAVADEAARAIEGAKDLTFDENFFTPDETDTEVNIKLNGVPFGVDDETPLQILQDTQEGLVLGADSPFNQAIAPAFSTTSTYVVGDLVIYKSKFYKCTTAVSTAGDWVAANWTEVSVDSFMQEIETGLDSVNDALEDMTTGADNAKSISIAPKYDATSTYVEKDLVMYAGQLYICSASGGIPQAETWDPTHWTAIDVDSVLGRCFIVINVFDSTNKTWTLDKTYAQIKDAYDKGLQILMVYNSASNLYMYGKLTRAGRESDHDYLEFEFCDFQDSSTTEYPCVTIGRTTLKDDNTSTTITYIHHLYLNYAGSYDESNLSSGKFSIQGSNTSSKLTLTTVSALTILANPSTPNFALTVDNSGNSNNVTVTVKTSNESSTLMYSAAAGNELTAGKIYQITCVGDCWTLAEFTLPS